MTLGSQTYPCQCEILSPHNFGAIGEGIKISSVVADLFTSWFTSVMNTINTEPHNFCHGLGPPPRSCCFNFFFLFYQLKISIIIWLYNLNKMFYKMCKYNFSAFCIILIKWNLLVFSFNLLIIVYVYFITYTYTIFTV